MHPLGERAAAEHATDFDTPSEAVAMGRAIESLEKPKAKERQAKAGPREGRGAKSGSENFTEPVARGDTRDLVGKAVGMSGVIYERGALLENRPRGLRQFAR